MRPLVLLFLLAASAASQPLPAPVHTGYDVFVVAGQSNARGRGDSLRSPALAPGSAYEALPRGEVVRLGDPVGGANTGSAWPAFARAYTEATRRGVVIIGLAEPGSGQVRLPEDRPEQTWDVRVEDNLFERAGPKIRRAMNALPSHLYNPRLAGWLWIQGGTDARRIDDGRLTPAEYEAGLHAFVGAVSATWGVPVYLFQTGTALSGDTPGAEAVRQIQANADALEEVVVVYRDAFTFPPLGWMADDTHWSQEGLNDAGSVGAAATADHQNSLPPVSSPLPGSPPHPAPELPSASVPAVPPMPAPPDLPEVPAEPVVVTGVYPNPATGALTLRASCAYRFSIVDARGRPVASGDGEGETPLPRLAPGLYVLRLASRESPADPACTGHRTLTVVR